MKPLILLFLWCCIVFFNFGCSGDRSSSSAINPDPLFKDQWYITDNGSGYEHINLTDTNNYTGKGVLVSVVDNGIDLTHEDLKANLSDLNINYLPEEFNFNDANHGTATAGIIAAVANNGIGIRGIAPQAQLAGFNALKTPSMSNIADALVQHKEQVWVSNNSWGDFNSWGEPFALRSLIEAALKDGVTLGRNGKGIIYVFSAGNGAGTKNDLPIDNVNYSGLVNNHYTIPVCAVDEYGKQAHYSEPGATLIVCAPSKGSGAAAITTTDVTDDLGYNPETFADDYADKNYTRYFGGTSAAAPIVSGVVALILQANPNLYWRDVRLILALSARKNDPAHIDWSLNSAGININHSYGFGVVDADAAIQLATTWQNLPQQKIIEYPSTVQQIIPDNDPNGITESVTVTETIKIEFIQITFNAPEHERLGDLEIVLVSPSGTRSVLAEQHNQLFEVFSYNNWRFGSMRHLHENSSGTWQLIVKDKKDGTSGNLESWSLKIYGYTSPD